MIAYTVIATFSEAAVAEEWIAWLRDEHLAEVIAAGAPGILDAEVIRRDGSPITCEVRYHFASRESFAAYERDHAPRLRAAGLARFAPERGVTYQRTLGEMVAQARR